MLERRPVLYICVNEDGAVRFCQTYDPTDGQNQIAVTWAMAPDAHALRRAVIVALGRRHDGRLLPVPGSQAGLPYDQLVTLCIAFRDALHILLEWPPGPPRN